MNQLQSALLELVLSLVLVALIAYLGGRVHEWRRQEAIRDSAFREGYNRIALRVFSQASWTIPAEGFPGPIERVYNDPHV